MDPNTANTPASSSALDDEPQTPGLGTPTGEQPKRVSLPPQHRDNPLKYIGKPRNGRLKTILGIALVLLLVFIGVHYWPWFGKTNAAVVKTSDGTLTAPADLGTELSSGPGKSEFVFKPAPLEERVISGGKFRVPPKEPTAWSKSDHGVVFMEPFIFEGSCSPEEAKAKIIASAKKNGVASECEKHQGYSINDYKVALWGWTSDDGQTHKKAYVLRSPRVERVVYGSEFKNSPEAVLASPEGKRLR